MNTVTDLIVGNIGNGICTSLTSPSGSVIQSPKYPNDYGASSQLLYLIEVPKNKRISLSVNVLSVDADIVAVSYNLYFIFSFQTPNFYIKCQLNTLQQVFDESSAFTSPFTGAVLPTPATSISNKLFVLSTAYYFS